MQVPAFELVSVIPYSLSLCQSWILLQKAGGEDGSCGIPCPTCVVEALSMNLFKEHRIAEAFPPTESTLKTGAVVPLYSCCFIFICYYV